ncbi:hypothetical protein FSP39_017628 [Pinctada imbricata]|uniref:Uncharacterized protein n=1 Tax=Pinctada imbricata TaxID=66713 RepID=A0AA88Y9V3_PINIB|nr:hypothetical protein FSP39_017628 [Pinctada imbricata]
MTNISKKRQYLLRKIIKANKAILKVATKLSLENRSQHMPPPQQGNVPTFIPLWDMRSMDRSCRRQGSIYKGLELDQRLFFLGAPSTYSIGQESEALWRIHERTRRMGDRVFRFLPPDFTSYHREESVVLPDGILYRIGSTLTRQNPLLLTSGCQTEERATSVSYKRDVATQSVTKEESTETQCEITKARIY